MKKITKRVVFIFLAGLLIINVFTGCVANGKKLNNSGGAAEIVDENEEYFYNYESQFQEPKEKLVSATITSEGMLNAIKRAKQLIELKWVPTASAMPGFFKKYSEYEHFNYIEGKEYQGIPYSSVYETNTYVGSNCSIETFISATCNPKSYLYTLDLQTCCMEPKAVTYYGMVCSKFVCYALGITETYNTAHIGDIPGMETVANGGYIDVDEILPADILNMPKSHTAIVTDVLRDKSGEVKYIEVAEETTVVKMRCRKWYVKDFIEHFGGYNLLRYKYLDSVEYKKSDFVNILDEKAKLDNRKYDILTKFGDKCNIDFSSYKENPITLDILTDSWEEAIIYFGDKKVAKVNIKDKQKLSFTPKKPGYYKVELKKGKKTSRPCEFCMYDSVLKVNSVSNDSFNVTYSSQTGKAVWFQLGEIADSVYKKSNGSGNETVTYTEMISNQKIRVAFENEYGVYLSRYNR